MKKIITLIFIAVLQSMLSAQAQQATPEVKSSVMVYSEDMEALIYKDEDQSFGKEIVIESIPDFSEGAVPVHISQMTKGFYTFKKDPKLVIPEFSSVVIEDTLTGNLFDLKNSDSYSFSINRSIPDRFVLQISKIKATFASMH